MSSDGASALGVMARLGASKALDTLERLTDKPWADDGCAAGPAAAALGLEATQRYLGAWIGWPGACALLCLDEKEAGEIAQAYVFSKIEPGEDFLDRRAEVMQRLQESALSELANIVVHSVANAWANACAKGFLLSAPSLLEGGGAEFEREALRRAGAQLPKAAATVSLRLASSAVGGRCRLLFWLSPEMVELLSAARPT